MDWAWAHIDLQLLRETAQAESLASILQPLGFAIRLAVSRIERAASAPDDIHDAIVDSECEMIEEFLGMAFVACQLQVTAIVSQIIRYGKRQSPDFAQNKKSLLRYGERLEGTLVTRVEFIDALANYYKHREEWNGDWGQLDPRARRTVEILRQSGLKQYSSGNFRDASKLLGNPDFVDVDSFVPPVRSWAESLLTTITG